MNWMRRLRFAWNQVLGRPAPKPTAAPLVLSHPVLGELSGTVEELRGSVTVAGAPVTLTLRPDGGPLDEVLDLAGQIVRQLPALHERSLGRICDESLDSYNDDWRVSQTVGADGKAVDIERPRLSAAEFRAQFKLVDIEACGHDLVAFWYDCGELFWGHSFCATSFDGVGGAFDVQMLG